MATITYSCRRMLNSPRFRLSRHFSSPSFNPRRVVVTGMGMVTPLGNGVETTWKRLIEGNCGVRGISPDDLKMGSFDEETKLRTFEQLSSKVAAVVPCGDGPGEFSEKPWLNSKEHRSMAKFIVYALSAADEALKDAKWEPIEEEQRERTISRASRLVVESAA